MSWEGRPLSACIEKVSVPARVPRKSFLASGPVPIVSQEAEFINGYWENDADAVKVSEPLVVFGDHTQVLKLIDFDFVVGADGVKLLKPKEFLDARFLKYFLEANPFPSLGYARHYRHISKLEVPLPPLEEQKRIIAVLDQAFSTLDCARANAEANLADAEEFFPSVIAQIFGNIDGCVCRPIGEVAEVYDGPHATPKTVEQGPLFLGISSLVDGRIELEKTRHVTEEDFIKWTRRVVPRAGDVVFSYETRLGQVGLIPQGMKCCLGRRMGLVRLDTSTVSPEYFTAYYLSPFFQSYLKEKTVLGTTVDRISIKDFPSFPLLIPSKEKQAEIVALIERIRSKHDAMMESVTAKLSDLDDLRQSILQRAFAGELT